MCAVSHPQRRDTAAGGELSDIDLFVDALLQFLHVRDDADEPVLSPQFLKGLQSFLERLGIEAAEAFIDKKSIELHSAGLFLDEV